MKKLFCVFVKYYFFLLLFFIAFRILFVTYNYKAIAGLPLSDYWGIFRYGIIMDFSVAGYFSLIPGLVFSIVFLHASRISTYFLKFYTLLCLIFLTILGLTDIGLYEPWGTRLDAQILSYLKTPGGIIASVSCGQIILFLILFLTIVLGSFFLYRRLFPQRKMETIKIKWYEIPIFLFLTAVLIIPIRGGFDRSPLNYSNVYFSEHYKADQFAYNFFWNFGRSVVKNQRTKVKVNYMSVEKAEATLKAEEKTNNQRAQQLIYPHPGKPTNVVLVLLESFSNKIIEPLGGMPAITPCLNNLCNEGIAFRSFYATGNRSDKGMSALIGGYPSSMNRNTILVFPDKMRKLDYFPKYFADHNYNMSFYYGGDVNFYNTRAVMLQAGIKKIVSKENFPLEVGLKQKWGVPDEYLYAKMFSDLKKEKEPFFSMVYNISSHEPFDIEGYNHIKGKATEQRYLNSVAYADSCLGVFIDSLKTTELWDHTLVIITADHTSLQPGPTSVTELASYNIPLILAGGVIKDHYISSRIGNHNDLAPMIIKQMNWKHKQDLLSKDFLTDNNYAFYFRMEGWGFVSPEAAWFDNINTNRIEYFYNNKPGKVDSLMNFAKAYVQYLHSR